MSGDKGEKTTEEWSQASSANKVKFRESTCYWCENPGRIFPDWLEAAYPLKDKWALKTATQILCA